MRCRFARRILDRWGVTIKDVHGKERGEHKCDNLVELVADPRIGLRRDPALADVAARDVSPWARRGARTGERGAEAAPHLERALCAAQVVFGKGWEPEKAGEAATVGHAATTRRTPLDTVLRQRFSGP